MNSRTESLHIHDEIPCIRKEAKRLKAAGVNIIIGLGHSGLKMDKKIAKEVEELDIIVGGHSHSLLYAPTGRYSKHTQHKCLHAYRTCNSYTSFIRKSSITAPLHFSSTHNESA